MSAASFNQIQRCGADPTPLQLSNVAFAEMFLAANSVPFRLIQESGKCTGGADCVGFATIGWTEMSGENAKAGYARSVSPKSSSDPLNACKLLHWAAPPRLLGIRRSIPRTADMLARGGERAAGRSVGVQ